MTSASITVQRRGTRRASDVAAAFYRAHEVSLILAIPVPTVYEISRTKPQALGAIRIGRIVRFRRAVVDRIAAGEE